MVHYINKDALVAEIRKRLLPVIRDKHYDEWEEGQNSERIAILDIIDTLEVIDPYELLVQYPSVKDAIQAHAEDYSWNIESELFQQLTPEQQKLWRKEIEQACISGGYSGLNLAKDPRYKENLEVKEVDSNDAFIEKACAWLKENIYQHIYKQGEQLGFPTAVFLEEFKKAMKLWKE